MADQPKELFGDAVTQTPCLRAFPSEDGIRVGSLVALAADASVPHLTPLSYVNASGNWAIWSGDAAASQTLTAHAATPASAGDFTLTVDGETTSAIAYNATAADVQAALEALSNVNPGDVTAVATTGANLGVASAVVTLTWQGAFLGVPVTLTANQTGISAGSDFVLASVSAGSDAAAVDGFLWAPGEAHAGLLAGETKIQVFRSGVIYYADVPLPAGETQSVLNAQLISMELRMKGIAIQGLPGVA